VRSEQGKSRETEEELDVEGVVAINRLVDALELPQEEEQWVGQDSCTNIVSEVRLR
jgi:hypothetical protein